MQYNTTDSVGAKPFWVHPCSLLNYNSTFVARPASTTTHDEKGSESSDPPFKREGARRDPVWVFGSQYEVVQKRAGKWAFFLHPWAL